MSQPCADTSVQSEREHRDAQGAQLTCPLSAGTELLGRILSPCLWEVLPPWVASLRSHRKQQNPGTPWGWSRKFSAGSLSSLVVPEGGIGLCGAGIPGSRWTLWGRWRSSCASKSTRGSS